MSSSEALERAPLRDRIYAIVRDRILRGELPPGGVVRDTELAEGLGASRTPVREALIRLGSEGLVESRVGRGFRVRPLLREEIEEVFPLLWTLEPLALEGSPAFEEAQAAELERITVELTDPEAPARRRHELDASWHRLLIGRCPNRRLLRYVEELRGALVRYETAYLQTILGMEQSVRDHRAIAAAFADGDREGASELLREHWHRGRGELLAMIPKETEP